MILPLPDLSRLTHRATGEARIRAEAMLSSGALSWVWRLDKKGRPTASGALAARDRSPFDVQVRWDGASLSTRCTCPQKVGICAHRLALALALRGALESGEAPPRPGPPDPPPPLTELRDLPVRGHLLAREGAWTPQVTYGELPPAPLIPWVAELCVATPDGPGRLIRDRAAEGRLVGELRRSGLRLSREGEIPLQGLPEGDAARLMQGLVERGWSYAGSAPPPPVTTPWRLRARLEPTPGAREGRGSFELTLSAERDGQVEEAAQVLKRVEAARDPRDPRLPPIDVIQRLRSLVGSVAALPKGAGGSRRVAPSQSVYIDEALATCDDVLAPPSWRALVDTLSREVGALRRPPLPPDLALPLRDYQQLAWAWLVQLTQLGLGALLADDMGLGKTATMLCYLLHLHTTGLGGGPARSPSLVVAPTSLLDNWRQEARRFTPTLRVHLSRGEGRSDGGRLTLPEGVQVVVTSYPLLRRDLPLYLGLPWAAVVLDEAGAIKNPESGISRAVRRLRALHPVALTGTPVENHPTDLWALFSFLQPDLLGSPESFRRRYAAPIDAGDRHAREELRRRVRPFVLRRIKEDVAPELPPLTETTLVCPMSTPHQEFYRRLLRRVQGQIRHAFAQRGREGARLTVLTGLLQLRLACCHPLLVDEAADVGPPAKLEVLLERLSQAVEAGHRVVIFSQFVKMLDLLERHLPADLTWERLDGQTPPEDRQARVDRFNRPGGAPLFLVSLKAGGSGLNLVGADYVFHYDPWWNPAVEDQATDRAHRLGQTRPVFAFRMITEGTIEEAMQGLHAHKRALASSLIEVDGPGGRGLSLDDLLGLLEIS